MTRVIQGLRWVKRLEGRPGCIPMGRPRGAKREGVRYEAALGGCFPGASRGVWFEYEDEHGRGFAQPDFLWENPAGVVVGEAKLTWRAEAYVQLRRLYFPLVTLLWGAPVGGMVICKNVTRETPRGEVTGELAQALAQARRGAGIPVLHMPLVG